MSRRFATRVRRGGPKFPVLPPPRRRGHPLPRGPSVRIQLSSFRNNCYRSPTAMLHFQVFTSAIPLSGRRAPTPPPASRSDQRSAVPFPPLSRRSRVPLYPILFLSPFGLEVHLRRVLSSEHLLFTSIFLGRLPPPASPDADSHPGRPSSSNLCIPCAPLAASFPRMILSRPCPRHADRVRERCARGETPRLPSSLHPRRPRGNMAAPPAQLEEACACARRLQYH